jgi:hypothetical protein
MLFDSWIKDYFKAHNLYEKQKRDMAGCSIEILKLLFCGEKYYL